MKKLYEILGQAPVKGDIGIEIEVEGHNLKQIEDPRWTTTNDGSLRGESYEYIFAKPLPVTKVRDALDSIKKELDDFGSELAFSFRTSVHVHVNCQELTYPQYLNFLYTYLLLEEPLMTYCGRERKGNRFCLRLQDAEGILEILNYMFRMGPGALQAIEVDNVRYAAMNIGATRNYGSLEFRGMRGNLDVDNLMTWVTSLHRLRKFAMSMSSPVEVYDCFSKEGAYGFMNKVLGGLAVKFMYPKAEREIQRSFSLSLDLPFSFREEVAVKEKAPRVRKNPLNAADIDMLRELDAQHRAGAQWAIPMPVMNDVNGLRGLLRNAAPVAPRAFVDDPEPVEIHFEDEEDEE